MENETTPILTKDQAIEAMQNGKKVIHIDFADDEFIYMKDGEIYDENGYKMRMGNIDFWTDRKGHRWETGWRLK